MSNSYNCVDTLCRAGIAHDDAIALRRISMTLHRWHELECGDGNEHSSWCVSRGHFDTRESRFWNGEGERPKPVFVYDAEGAPYLERHYNRGDAKAHYTRIGDRERGALKLVAKIMARYPAFQSYVQGDPRGCSLYILRPGDVRDGASLDSCYSNGVAVCK